MKNRMKNRMKIIWKEQDGTEKTWEGDFVFKDLGNGVRVTDKVTRKVKCFFGEYKAIRE